jgi:hypothetical protein
MHPRDYLARELAIQHFETRGDQLLRTLPHLQFFHHLAVLTLGSPGDEFRKALEQPEVDLAEALRQHLPAAVGGAAKAASRQFDEPRFRKV